MIARYFQSFTLHVSLVTGIFRTSLSVSQQCQLRQGNKTELVRCLQGTTKLPPESPQVDVKVFDGAVVVYRCCIPKQHEHSRSIYYVQTVFLPYVNAQLHSAVRLDIVWDTHKEDSLKKSAREKRGSGARRSVSSLRAVSTGGNTISCTCSLKTELIRLLAEEVVSIDAPGKEVYSTQGNHVEGLQPCSHEEADT